MPVLITGGSGFVGLNLAEALLMQGRDVVLFDLVQPPDFTIKVLSPLGGILEVVTGDVRDPASVDRAFWGRKIEQVVHTAAITPNQERERRDPRSIFEVNVLGTLEVLRTARQNGVNRIIVPSSIAVYGNNSYAWETLDEVETPPAPDTLYAISKYAGERASLRLRDLWTMEIVVVRIGAVFGPWERNTGVRDTLSPLFQVTRLAQERRHAVLPRMGSRDWVYSRDVAGALIALLDRRRLRYDVYNIGSGMVWSVADWCARLQKTYSGFSYRISEQLEEVNVDYYASRDRAPLAIRRLIEDIGFQPGFGLDRAFTDYVEWMRIHPEEHRSS